MHFPSHRFISSSPISPGPAALLLPLLLASACSSGGSSDDEEVASSVVYQFGTQVGSMVATGAADWDLTFLFDGGVDVVDEEFFVTTQNPYTVSSGASYGDLEVGVLVPWIVSIGGRARAGSMEVHRVDTGERIRIDVDPSIGVLGGVHLFLDDGGVITGPFTHEWDVFESLLETGGFAPFEEAAAYAHLATVFALDRFELVIDVIARTFLNQEELDDAGPGVVIPISDVCETLPGGTPATFGLTWEDVNADRSLTDGDTIQALFADCWFNRTGRPDSLYSGMIQLTNVVSNDDPFLALALVQMTDFQESRTREIMTDVHEIVMDSEVTTNAVLSATFFED